MCAPFPALLRYECISIQTMRYDASSREWNATRGNSRRTSWFGSKYTHIEAKRGRARTFMRPRRAHRLVSTWISGELSYAKHNQFQITANGMPLAGTRVVPHGLDRNTLISKQSGEGRAHLYVHVEGKK